MSAGSVVWKWTCIRETWEVLLFQECKNYRKGRKEGQEESVEIRSVQERAGRVEAGVPDGSRPL